MIISGENFGEIMERGASVESLSHAEEGGILVEINSSPITILLLIRAGSSIVFEKLERSKRKSMLSRSFFADLIRFESFI